VLEHLWNGWRATYVQGLGADRTTAGAGSGSVFTQLLCSGLPDEETHVLHRSSHCFALLNVFPYAAGHVLVVPYREVPDLEDLTPEETADLWSLVADTVRAVRGAMRPEGLNVGLNLGRPAGGSVAEHLHVHVVPRWTGDSNFMTAVANTRTLPEALPDTARRLRAAWPVEHG
jgi:ATP adenylyltransferase